MSQYTRLLKQYQPKLDNPFITVQEYQRIQRILGLANTVETKVSPLTK